MIHRNLLASLALTWALSAAVSDLRAATVLNTFAGPGATATGATWRLGTDPDPHAGSTAQAVGFYLDDATTLDSVITTIEGNGTVRLSIVGDMTTSGFGPTYFTTHLTDPRSKELLDGLNVALPAGRYWLVAEEAPSFTGGWQGGGATVTSPWRFYMSRLGWADWGPANPPAVMITSAVPEPATGLFMLGGITVVGLIGVGRRRARPAP